MKKSTLCANQDIRELISQTGTFGRPCKGKRCASCKRYYKPGLGSWRCCECNPCFPAEARVSLESGKSLTMSELEIGDRIQTGIKNVHSGFKMKNKILFYPIIISTVSKYLNIFSLQSHQMAVLNLVMWEDLWRNNPLVLACINQWQLQWITP